MAFSEVAYAKINLALHVRSRGADGYHCIETLFAFAAHGDILSVEPSSSLALEITGPFAAGLSAGPDNLVMRAAQALHTAFGIGQGAALTLDKRLPVASGIGGGSADAAAALRLLARFWGISPSHPEILRIAEGLGADVPACLLSRTCRGEGRGTDLEPIAAPELAGMPLLLVNPCVPLATGPVFSAWDRVDRGELGRGAPLTAALAGRNDLQLPAMRIQPVIGDVLNMLQLQPGTRLVRMSGSGATCFALFETAATRDTASAAIASAHPGWWQLASQLR